MNDKQFGILIVTIIVVFIITSLVVIYHFAGWAGIGFTVAIYLFLWGIEEAVKPQK